MSMKPTMPYTEPGSEKGTHALAPGAAAKVVQKWADYGCCEPSVAETVAKVAAMDVMELREKMTDHIYVLLGATSELGPFETLMEMGCTVVCISRNGAKLTKLLGSMKKRAGSVVVPSRVDTSVFPANDAEAITGVVGADLIAQTPEVIAWLSSIFPEKTLILDALVYLDGEANVRASVAMEMICDQVAKNRGKGKTALAYLVSPATAYPVPREARDASVKNYNERTWLMAATGATANYEGDDVAGGKQPVVDGCVIAQGPNYCLAKTMQQWRAIVSREEGIIVSANHAPPCRTVSVVRSPVIAAALNGMAFFEPCAAFDPKTASAVMTILMLWDLVAPESSANPTTQLANPNDLFMQNAFHGGGWRCAYNSNAIGMLGYALGRASGLVGYQFDL